MAVPPSRLDPRIPEDLERVVMQCLAKAPDDRFPDAESLEHALSACACAADWNQERAARWWRDVAQPAHRLIEEVGPDGHNQRGDD
jgi:serine/threonine-protein kinase